MLQNCDPAKPWREAAETLGVSQLLLNQPPGLLLAAHRLTIARCLPQAEAAYLELIRIAPRHRVGLLNLINLLHTQGRQRDALPFRKRIIELDVDSLNLDEEEKAATLEARLIAALILPRPAPSATEIADPQVGLGQS